QIKICTGYEYQGEVITEFPTKEKVLVNCEPVYETLPGWQEDTTGITDYEDLPANAKQYVDRICELTGVKLDILSVGPKRKQTMVLNQLFNK
ncbi:MAG: adenylosuccinate synthetase, partial [Bacillota bacterium]